MLEKKRKKETGEIHDMNFSDEMRSIKSNFSLFVSRAIGVLFSEIKLILVDFWESS